MAEFPSFDQLTELRERGGGGGNALTGLDRLQYHAYTYGFRRAVLFLKDNLSPIDPGAKYFDPYLANAAEELYRETKANKARSRQLAKRNIRYYQEREAMYERAAAWRRSEEAAGRADEPLTAARKRLGLRPAVEFFAELAARPKIPVPGEGE